MTPDKKISRKFGLTILVVCLACIGLISRHINWNNKSAFSASGRFLVEVRSIVRAPGDKSAIPQIQEPNGQSIFSSFSSWFAPSNALNADKVSSSSEAGQGTNTVAGTSSTSKAIVPASKAATSTTSTTSAPGSSTNTFGTSGLSREQCRAKYGERSYLPEDRKKLPPMLYTFPGAGNTWCRLLIEYGTGIYSGSVYNDKSLLESLPGEFTCNHQVSVIKIHPHTHPFEGLRTGYFQSDASKCPRGHVDKIKRAILVLRDPFDSIWSEFQRRITQSHVGGIPKSAFDWHQWQANAAAMSHAYNLMWSVQHAGIEKHFPPSDYLYVKYEDLKNKAARVDTLEKIARFLDISPIERERLECAFALADKRDTHRVLDAHLMSKTEAYTKPLACRMWALFGTHASKHGYTMWQNINCTVESNEGPFPPIPRINVGPQGEYNHKWVKPGGKLIDFGGHPPNQPGAGQKRLGGGGGGGGNGGNRGNGGGGSGVNRGNKPPKFISGGGAGNFGGSGGGSGNSGVTAAAAAVSPLATQQTQQQLQLQQAQLQVPQKPQNPQAQQAAPKSDVEALAAAARRNFLEQKRQQMKQGKTGKAGAKSGDIGGGMTIQEASRRESVIAAVGADKPAWQ